MAIGRRTVLAGGAALWVGGSRDPAGAELVQGPCQPWLRHAWRAQVRTRCRASRLPQSRRSEGRHGAFRRPRHLRFAAPLHRQERSGLRRLGDLGFALLVVARRGFDRIRADRRDDRVARGPLLGRLHAAPAGALARRQPDHGRGRDLHLRHPEVQGRAQLRLLLPRRAEGGESRRPQGEVHLPRRHQPRAAVDRRAAPDPAVEVVGDARFREGLARGAAGQRRLQGRRPSTPAGRSPTAACPTGGPRTSG